MIDEYTAGYVTAAVPLFIFAPGVTGHYFNPFSADVTAEKVPLE
jgi:hypothetical protein